MFEAHVPLAFKKYAPRVIVEESGKEQWYYGELRDATWVSTPLPESRATCTTSTPRVTTRCGLAASTSMNASVT